MIAALRALVAIISLWAGQQADARPCSSLPVAPGTTWTYDVLATWAGSDSAPPPHHDHFRWTTTVKSVQTRGSRSVAVVSGWPFELAFWEPGRRPALSVLYCSAGRIYHLRPGVDSVARALADTIFQGTRRPTSDDLILELPLHEGQLFARDSIERQDPLYAWFTESAEPLPAALARFGPGIGDTVFRLAYRTLPDHQLVAYVAEVGVVEYAYGHHGTTAESVARLIAFRRGHAGAHGP